MAYEKTVWKNNEAPGNMGADFEVSSSDDLPF